MARVNRKRQAVPAIVRTFAGYDQAREAIRALEAAQVSPTDISVVTRSTADARTLERDTGASEDLEDSTQRRHRFSEFLEWLGRVESVAVPGFGAVLGTGNLWQDVSMAGSGRGAITGALVGLGLPVDEAADLEKAVFNGQILVVVHGTQDLAAIEAVLGSR